MIAPIRETDAALDEHSRVLARARRAVATALIRQASPAPPATKAPRWKSWSFAIWTVLLASVAIAGAVMGWWNRIDY